jgi:oligopeptide transport system permease protein
MIRMVLSRLVQLPLILIVIYTLTLLLAWKIPGNPLENPEGRRPPAEVAEALKAQYNLDSFGRFYWSYLLGASGVKYAIDASSGRLAAEHRRAVEAGTLPPRRPIFDLGPSLQYRDRRVNEILASSLPVSIALGAAAILIALFVGVGAGVVGAARPGSAADGATLSLALVGISVPSFVAGTLLLLLFSVRFAVFPVAEWGHLRDMVLPAITLSLPFAAYIARLTRSGMIDALKSDYVRTARAKGVPERDILLRHALKNAFLPVLNYLGPASAYAMTGSFVVERVFNVPGLGQHFVNAVQNKDLFLIIGVVLVFSTLLILFNLAVDVMHHWIDPRIA